MIVAGDICGTKTVVALFEEAVSLRTPFEDSGRATWMRIFTE